MHAAVTPETLGLMGADQFAGMREGSIYINSARAGLHDLDAVLTYPETLHYKYVETTDVTGYMVPGDTLPLSELVFLMLSVSDNVASLWIQGLVGGAEVNAWLDAHGFSHTRLNARTPGREASGAVYGWGQTTPREMADLFVRIREGRAVNPRADEEMYRLLTKSYWQGAALSQIPPTVQAAWLDGSGTYNSFSWATASDSRTLTRPGSTTARRAGHRSTACWSGKWPRSSLWPKSGARSTARIASWPTAVPTSAGSGSRSSRPSPSPCAETM